MTDTEHDLAYVSIGEAAYQVWRALAVWAVLFLFLLVVGITGGGGLAGAFWPVAYLGGAAGIVWRGHQVVRRRYDRLDGLPRV